MSRPRWAPVDRDLLRASGPDALSFLQGQLSQDVSGLAVGASAFSFVLQPAGKVDVFLRATRTGDDEVVLDTDAGWGAALAERLERFKLRTRCELETLSWRCIAVRGLSAGEAAGQVPTPEGHWAVVAEIPDGDGYDVIGPAPAAPQEAVPMEVGEYETMRIAAGVPRMGSEIDQTTIPAAAGVVDRAVSFTKGCFTGQELVARIDSRGGNVPQRLCRVLASGDPAPPGTPVRAGDREAGRITSSSAGVGGAGMVGLAYIHRSVEVPSPAVLVTRDGEVPATIEPLREARP